MKARFLALAALVLGLASCQTEHEGLNVNVGGEQETYVTVSLPETTRANSALGAFDNVVTSDEYTIRYIFQVFYEGRESQAARQVIYTDNDRVSFPVRLVPGRHYNFVVWADVTTTEGKTLNTIHNLAIDDAAAADIHYNTADLKNIQIIDVDGGHEWEEMDETRDAFTGQFDTAVDGDKTAYNSAKSINFTLTRPFAKLRVITTDMEQLNDLDIVPTKAAVTYATDHLYSSFNAFAGAVNDAKTTKTHDTFVIKNYNDNVTNKSKVLFTDYLFAADQDEVVNFTLTVYDQYDVIIGKTINFNTPIPARRNYLTTISGNILTDGNKIEVTVEDTFANYDEDGNLTNPNYEYATISSVAELLAAIDANNGEYILISDLDVNGVTTSALAATRATGAGTTINLNGYTITLKTNLTIPEGNTLIINNDPVDNAGDKLGAVVNAGGKLVNNGTLNIEGGAFGANTIENNGKVNVNGDDVDDNAIVNGEDAVVGSFIYNIDQLKEAVKNAVAGTDNEFTFAANIEGEVTISQEENVNITINGAGFEFDGTITIDGNWRGDKAEFVKFQNIKFNAKDASKYYNEGTSSMNFIYAPFSIGNRQNLYAHNIIVDGCTFTGGETVVGLNTRQANKITVTNSTFTGMHSLGQIRGNSGYAKFDRVTVECLSGINFNDQAVNIEISNSSITATEADGYAIRMDAQNPGNVLVNGGCTFKADRPVIVRRLTSSFDLEFTGVNTLETKQTYQVVLTNLKDDKAYEAPTGTYELTGADDFIVYPRDVVSSWDEFTAALAAGKTFFLLGADITYDNSCTITKDVTIDLNGKSFEISNASARLNIGDKDNKTKPNVTIKNGNLNCKVYALSGNVTINDVVFGGTIAYAGDSQGVVNTKHASLLMENCNMKNVKMSGGTKPRSISTEGRSSGYLIFRKCDFKNSNNLDRPYINPLNGNAVLEITDCALFGGASNIDLGASYVWSNLNLTGCSGGFTFTISRASTSLTEEELTIYRAIKQNNSGSKRFIFTDGEKNYL